jgi:hypothetical protein
MPNSPKLKFVPQQPKNIAHHKLSKLDIIELHSLYTQP